MTAQKVLERVVSLIAALTAQDQRWVADAVRSRFISPLTAAERASRYRDVKRHDTVTTFVTAPLLIPSRSRDENRNGLVTKSPRPPVVASSSFFEKFWSVFPKKVGKGAARASWNKQSLDNKAEKILDALQQQGVYLNREGGKFTPNPATWLNQTRWEDTPPSHNILSEKTRGNVDAARAFVEGKGKE